jgi:dihydrofolate synthase/folylpolyglutamate synthase
MRLLVREFGHPERSFKSVLIAGTNGKGSVSAYLDEALRSASLRIGRYTSPHLIDVRERITVSGRNIGNAEFERLVIEVRDRSEHMRLRGLIENHPNHFEILTMVAFLHFQKQEVDIAVLEVGMGGRLDATNVTSPLVSAIVSIDFDHEEYLGPTLSSIASEKAGVLRRNREVILGPMAPEAERTIRRLARNIGARVVPAFQGVSVRASAAGLIIKTPLSRYSGARPLQGAHQRSNLVVAIRALEALAAAGAPLDLTRSVQAMNGVVWPGRLERIEGRPAFLLDGAHNPAGARALSRYLAQSPAPYVLVFGAMRDKHVLEMARELFPRARLVVATRVRMKRAATAAHLAAIGRDIGVRVIEEPSIRHALSKAARNARGSEMIVVAGSLYLVGAVRKRLLQSRAQPKPPGPGR